MADYIDRQKAIDAVWEGCGACGELIAQIPAADVRENKNGKWERHYSRPGVYADLLWHCSACGGGTDNQYAHVYFKFCPYCGAVMEEE